MKNWLKKALSLFGTKKQEIDPKKVDAWPFPIEVKKPTVAKATTRKAKITTEKPVVKKAKKTVKKVK